MEEDEPGHDGGHRATTGELVSETGEGIGEAAEAIHAATRGNAGSALAKGAGAVGAGLQAVASAVGHDDPAHEELEAASEVFTAAGSVVETGESMLGGHTGQTGHGAEAGNDVSRHVVPESQAQDVLREGRGLGQGLGGQAAMVEYHLEISGVDGPWGVTQASIDEALNRVPSCSVTAHHSGHPEAAELLHKECSLTFGRQGGAPPRDFKGIVWHARVDERHEGTEVTLHVVSAMAYLAARTNSKIFQQQSVVDVIKEVYEHLLSPRTVDVDLLQRTYETREYIVQYQESDLAFISRLAEEEGIFWFLDYADDQEVLVLADATANLQPVDGHDQGQVNYHQDPEQAPGDESAFEVRHFEEVGPTDVVVSDYDWTNPPLRILAKHTERAEAGPPLEIFDHTDALILHDYAGEQYEGNTAKIQARLHMERIDLDRKHWEVATTVVTALPGRTIELVGCPIGDLDQRYLIVSSQGSGTATEGESGSWSNTLELVPVSMPYRPPRATPRPVVHGPETATVVGDDEIHTDEHGRVKVHFHWDRWHARTAEDSSVWMRVSQNWAGPGFGTFFLPRVGMEVMVSFLGGNPDRPVVTGCIYNGHHRAGVKTPVDKTQSLIRTKSSPNSDGFNELRFEDKAGSEFIYTHAEKDYNEDVEHNHSTHVKNCQTNTVDVDQTETVGNNQTLHVKKDRKKTVDVDEANTVKGNRTTTIGPDGGDDNLTVKKNRLTKVEGATDVLIVPKGNKQTSVGKGKWEVDTKQRFLVAQNKSTTLELNDSVYVDTSGKVNIKSGSGKVVYSATDTGFLTVEAKGEIHIHADQKMFYHSKDAVKIQADQKIILEAPTEIMLNCGPSSIKLSQSGIEITGPVIKINATSGNTEIDAATQVKLKA